MTNIIKNFAEKNNIIVGVCHAAPLELPQPTTPVPFVSADFEKRTNPERTLRGAKSIIVVGIASASLIFDNDYHVRVKNLLRELFRELCAARGDDDLPAPHNQNRENALLGATKKRGDFNHKILVDSPGLDERSLARRAGLGFFGRNGLIISKKFGSRFNIGCLLCDAEIPEFAEKHEDFPDACPRDCDLCIAACPTNALADGKFNIARCLSYLTQKDALSPDEEKLITLGGQIYGCEICQNACIFNSTRAREKTDLRSTVLRESKQSLSREITPQDWLLMSDEDFKNTYGHTAILWRGVEILRRNARILSL
ncbi:MAG: hypothetical protein FWD19_04060 [Defluviitaleaceae bacterium]|nr:hypothetical protein [Defluviitaleaceae bacterium]